jgi:hypothetical protein
MLEDGPLLTMQEMRQGTGFLNEHFKTAGLIEVIQLLGEQNHQIFHL